MNRIDHVNATATGIGRTLKVAREGRGKSLEEASRETRIRAEYLEALEREAFDRLLGDVYVRGFLRSYSSYLGLDADKILRAYAHRYGNQPSVMPAAPSSPQMATTSEGHPLIHRSANWRLAVGAAAAAVALVAVITLVARTNGNEVMDPPAPVSAEPSTPPVVANLVAIEEVQARILVDGRVVFEGILARGEARSLEGHDRILFEFASGGTVRLTINGAPQGAPGVRGEPFQISYGPQDFRGSPSSGG